MSDTRTTLADWPDCATEGCDGKILLNPDNRKVCARCEMAGVAPRTELPSLPEPYAAK